MDSLSVQLYAFGLTLLAGATTGLVFDLYRLSRSWLRPGMVATAIMDLFFWLVAAPVITIYLLLANWGELRFYVFVGIALGLALYYLIFSRLFINIFLGIFHFIGRALFIICQIVFALFSWPIRVVQDVGISLNIRRRGRSRFTSGLRWNSSMFMFFKRR